MHCGAQRGAWQDEGRGALVPFQSAPEPRQFLALPTARIHEVRQLVRPQQVLRL